MLTWISLVTAVSLALALSACSKKASDHCRTRTGDGICVDLPPGNASIIDETGIANTD